MSKLVVADADALIALILELDPHHQTAIKITNYLMRNGFSIIFPSTVFPEAITSLKRALNQPQKAHIINKQYLGELFEVEYIDEVIMKQAVKIFDQKIISKKHTLFDAIVASTAEKLNTKYIFSFDEWYPKQGFKLAQDLMTRL